MSSYLSDFDHAQINASILPGFVIEIHLVSDPVTGQRRVPKTKTWTVDRVLGHGSNGEVRLETHKHGDVIEVRAVKRMLTSGAKLRMQYEREVKALLEFSKPKYKETALFVEFLGWFEDHSGVYLALEYAPFGDLEQNISNSPMPESEVKTITTQILEGLKIMHQESFIHRDLKPRNVLIYHGPPQWWIKLADFGVSKRCTDDTQPSTLVGTMSYMAPEVLGYFTAVSKCEYTAAVDLWALGCIVFRLLAGTMPFPNGSALIRYCEGSSGISSRASLNFVSEEALRLVTKLLIPNPDTRLTAVEALDSPWLKGGIFSHEHQSSDSSIDSAANSDMDSNFDYNTATHPGLRSERQSIITTQESEAVELPAKVLIPKIKLNESTYQLSDSPEQAKEFQIESKPNNNETLPIDQPTAKFHAITSTPSHMSPLAADPDESCAAVELRQLEIVAYQDKLGRFATLYESLLTRKFQQATVGGTEHTFKLIKDLETRRLIYLTSPNNSEINLVKLRDCEESTLQEISLSLESTEPESSQHKIVKVDVNIPYLKLLRPTDYDRYKRKIPSAFKGTCQWFLRHPNYHKWLQDERPALLWFTAGTGCSKSVISKLLIDEELTWSPFTTCHFFFAGDDPDQRSLRNALVAILHQLLTKRPLLFILAIEMFRAPHIPDVNTLWSTLMTVTQNDSQDTICVLDAIDECDWIGQDVLLSKLREFAEQTLPPTRCKLKFLITSRPEDNLVHTFNDITHIRLAGENETKSIDREVNLMFEFQLPNYIHTYNFPESLSNSMLERLHQHAAKTFLWMPLAFSILQGFPDQPLGSWSDAIVEFPLSLSSAYKKLAQMCEQPEDLQHILCILVAADRPLDLKELEIAMNVHSNCNKIIDLRLQGQDKFKNRLQKIGGPLITIHHDSVYLIHRSVRTILVNDYLNKRSTHSITSTPLRKADEVLAQACIRYLLLENFKRRPLLASPPTQATQSEVQRYSQPLKVAQKRVSRYLNRYPFLKYAATNWLHHLRRADCRDKFKTNCMELFNNAQLFRNWFIIFSTPLALFHESYPMVKFAECLADNEVQHHFLHSGVVPNNFKDPRGSLLSSSIIETQAKMLQTLLDNGATIEATLIREPQNTALMLAVDRGQLKIVELLLDNGADVRAKDSFLTSTLEVAASKGDQKVVSLLIERRSFSQDEKDKALLKACLKGHAETVEMLLNSCVDIGLRGSSALWAAIRGGHENVVTLLIDHGADIEGKDSKGRTALIAAAERGFYGIVLLLLDIGADLEATASDGSDALIAGVKRGHCKVVDLLLERGANIEQCGSAVLGYAILYGHQDVVKILLNGGIDTRGTRDAGATFLVDAAEREHPEMVQLLLDHDADIEAKKPNGWNALLTAVAKRNKDLVSLLLDRGANIEAKDSWSTTALLLAACKGFNELVKLLLDRGANIEARNTNGSTALIRAAKQGYDQTVQLLADRGAKIEAKDTIHQRGRTALVLAVGYGHADVVRILLENGADANARDEDGRTLYQRAGACGRTNIQEMLDNRGLYRKRDRFSNLLLSLPRNGK